MPNEAVTEIRPHEQVVLVAVLKRSLDDATSRKLVDDVLTAGAARPGIPIVLDMSQVRFAPSVALGLLVQMCKGLQIEGRRIALIALDQRVLGAVRVTHLHTLMEIHDTLDQVLAVSPRPARVSSGNPRK